MNDRSRRGRSRALIGLAATLAAVGIWMTLRSDGGPKTPPAEEEPEPEVAVEPPPRPTARPVRAAAPPPPPAEPEHVADDGLPFMPPGPNDPRPDGPVHPHPITPEHRRIFAENRLIGALNGAMDVKDAAAMRRFLEQYRRDYPEDANDLHDGYAVIIDCFENPGPASRAAAERWAEEHRGSTLRRFVNRHCLEAGP